MVDKKDYTDMTADDFAGVMEDLVSFLVPTIGFWYNYRELLRGQAGTFLFHVGFMLPLIHILGLTPDVFDEWHPTHMMTETLKAVNLTPPDILDRAMTAAFTGVGGDESTEALRQFLDAVKEDM